jgi:hypothetical protein
VQLHCSVQLYSLTEGDTQKFWGSNPSLCHHSANHCSSTTQARSAVTPLSPTHPWAYVYNIPTTATSFGVGLDLVPPAPSAAVCGQPVGVRSPLSSPAKTPRWHSVLDQSLSSFARCEALLQCHSCPAAAHLLPLTCCCWGAAGAVHCQAEQTHWGRLTFI